MTHTNTNTMYHCIIINNYHCWFIVTELDGDINSTTVAGRMLRASHTLYKTYSFHCCITGTPYLGLNSASYSKFCMIFSILQNVLKLVDILLRTIYFVPNILANNKITLLVFVV